MLASCSAEVAPSGDGSSDAAAHDAAGNDADEVGIDGDAAPHDSVASLDTAESDTAAGSDTSDSGAGQTDTAASDTAALNDTASNDTAPNDTASNDTASNDTASNDTASDDAGADPADTADLFACQGPPGCDKHGDATSCKADEGCNWTDCIPSKAPAEICDSVDNDCDGVTDNPVDKQGTPLCEDGDVCNGVSLCQAGSCSTAVPLVCTEKPCFDVACDKEKGCVHTPNTAGCDDGDACTGTGAQSDVCAAGGCKSGVKVVCDDKNPCTSDSCDPKKGCTTTPKSGACDDGDACTVSDACAEGLCAGGKPLCDDGNPCTQDLCDKQSTKCSATTIAGCKLCTAKSQCDDKDACTSDACTGGKCVQNKIAGCFGPTDFVPVKLVSAAATTALPGKLLLKFTARNDGVAFAQSGWNTKVEPKLMLWWSSDNTIDAADVVAYPETKWGYANAANLKPGSPEGTTDLSLTVVSEGTASIKTKYLCVRIISVKEIDQTNNDLCAPVPKMTWPEHKVAAFVPTTNALEHGQKLAATVSYQHQKGDPKQKFAIALFASKDDKFDVDDIMLTTKTFNGVQTAGEKTYQLGLGPYFLPMSVTPGHKWLCAAVNYNKGLFPGDSTPNDNSKCVAVTIKQVPAVHFNQANDLSFSSAQGVGTATPKWGSSYHCRAAKLPNLGYAAGGNFAARCWIVANKLSYTKPATVSWATDWQVTATVPPASYPHQLTGQTSIVKKLGELPNVLSTAAVKLDKVPIPIDSTKAKKSWLCMDLNHDKKAVPANSAAGVACREISVKGFDMSVEYANTALGSAYYGGPQPSSVARNKALRLVVHLCNFGNIDAPGVKNKLAARVLLSQDKIPSADDYVVWKGVDKFHANFPHYQPDKFQKSGCYGILPIDATVTIPTSVKAGKYNLIFEVNHDKKFLEPGGNNLVIRPGLSVL